VIPEVIKTTGIQFTNIEEGVYETDKLQLNMIYCLLTILILI
jgi:hypothetical protein